MKAVQRDCLCGPRQERNLSSAGVFRYLYDAKKRYRIVTAPLTLKPVATDWGSDISICEQTESLAQIFERWRLF